MRYLFVTWDGGGNLHCVLPLAARLVRRGHEVEFLGNRSQRGAIEEQGCSFAAFQRAPESVSSSASEALLDDWKPRSLLATNALYRDKLLVAPAPLFAADTLAAIERCRPDAVAVDYFLFGALAAAERSGLPSAALWHTVYAPPEVDVPAFASGQGLPRGLPSRLTGRAMRGLSAAWWKRTLPSLNATRAGLGLPPLGRVFEQYDRLDRVLVMSSAAFDFAALTGAAMPANVRYVGPQISPEKSDAPQPVAKGDPPLVLVSFSTTYQAQDELLRRTIAALGQLPVRALVTTGPAISLDGALPANVETSPWVSHAEVLPRTSLVLTHGGHGTAMASLAHGVPLICMPMGRDQPCVAARVTHSGAGLRLSKKPSQREISGAIRTALATPSLRENAERLQGLIASEISTDPGVEELQALGRALDPFDRQAIDT